MPYYPMTEDGTIHYTLTVDNKEIPLTDDRVSSTWIVALADGLHQVEFEHKSYDILVDGIKVEAGKCFRPKFSQCLQKLIWFAWIALYSG